MNFITEHRLYPHATSADWFLGTFAKVAKSNW